MPAVLGSPRAARRPTRSGRPDQRSQLDHAPLSHLRDRGGELGPDAGGVDPRALGVGGRQLIRSVCAAIG